MKLKVDLPDEVKELPETLNKVTGSLLILSLTAIGLALVALFIAIGG